jgi:5-methylcytosine-specific restriction endonuclease McrA
MRTSCLSCRVIISRGSYCHVCQPAKARKGSTRQWRILRWQILERDRYTCRHCGAPATHVDHLVPVARGGTDNPANLAASCPACNLEKGAR